jgi:TonB family protein
MKPLATALAAIAALMCAVQPVLAQPAHALATVGDTIVYPGDAAYPADLAARGVQGRALLRVHPGPDGKAARLAIVESTRSRELDQAALALARSYAYRP